MTDLGPARLTPEVEARLAAVSAAAEHNDFDGVGWFWMIALGIVGPVLLIAFGWFFGPGAS
jgi:hypothetical protein